VIRTSRDNFRVTWAALTFLDKVNHTPVIFRVLHVGGTIRCCQRFLINYDKALVSTALDSIPEEEEEGEEGEEGEEEDMEEEG
jgi:ribonuclease P/MRP protein subunit POP5